MDTDIDSPTNDKILTSASKTGCPFDGDRISGSRFAGNGHSSAIYNLAPIVPGHSLIVPQRHVERLMDLGDFELCQFFVFARRVTALLLAEFRADGFDWSIQDGENAGQTVAHVHLHVIPRRKNDLPDPGDWYDRLNLPVVDSDNGVVDSADRVKLSDRQMDTIVERLRAAAAEHQLDA